MKWLSENRQWVFSGIGVLFISLAVAGVVRILQRARRDSISTAGDQSPLYVGGNYTATKQSQGWNSGLVFLVTFFVLGIAAYFIVGRQPVATSPPLELKISLPEGGSFELAPLLRTLGGRGTVMLDANLAAELRGKQIKITVPPLKEVALKRVLDEIVLPQVSAGLTYESDGTTVVIKRGARK